MRAIDRLECKARGRDPKAALRLALRPSPRAPTRLSYAVPHAMFGISPVSAIEDRGCPWFLGSDEVMRHGRDMLTIGRSAIERMHEHSARLENSVSVDNAPALRLLRRWGFTVSDRRFTIGGMDFVRFWREG